MSIEQVLLILQLTVTSGAAIGVMTKGYHWFTRPIVEQIKKLDHHIIELKETDKAIDERISSVERYLDRRHRDFRYRK